VATATRSGAPLTRVLVASVLYSIVEYCYWAGVLFLAFDVGGASLAGLVLLIQLVPAALLAPYLGGLSDRIPRGTALSLSYLFEAVFLAVLAVAMRAEASIMLVVAVSAIATIGVSIARPLHYAALPQLAPDPARLVRANAVSSFGDGAGLFIGPAVAGVLGQSLGLWLIPAFSALCMLVAAALVTGLRLPRGVDEEGADDVAFSGALAGLRIISRDGPVLALLLLVGISFVVTGSFEILGVAFAVDVLGEEETSAGLILGATGIGVLIGSVISAGLALRARLAPAVVLGLVAAGLPLLVMTAAGALPTAVLLLTVSGAAVALSNVASRTLLQRTTEPVLLARVFAIQEAVLLLGLALGAVIGPVLVGWVGAAESYLPVGVGLVVIALLVWPAVRRLDLRAVFRPEVLLVLRRVRFLSAMSPPAMERLSQSAEWLEVPAGTVVIEQGDIGDAYYAIDSGRLSVTVDGTLQSHTMGPGDGFGEIALLRDVPRTATIVAVEDCRLLRVEREAFMAAATGVEEFDSDNPWGVTRR